MLNVKNFRILDKDTLTITKLHSSIKLSLILKKSIKLSLVNLSLIIPIRSSDKSHTHICKRMNKNSRNNKRLNFSYQLCLASAPFDQYQTQFAKPERERERWSLGIECESGTVYLFGSETKASSNEYMAFVMPSSRSGIMSLKLKFILIQ